MKAKSLLFKSILFICIFLFLVALGLRCCALVFSSCGKQGLFFIVLGLLTAGASLVAECRPQGTRASVVAACGSRVQAQLL